MWFKKKNTENDKKFHLICVKCNHKPEILATYEEKATLTCENCGVVGLGADFSIEGYVSAPIHMSNSYTHTAPKEKIVKAMAESFKVTKDVSDYKPVQEKNDEKFVGKYVDVD
jgi:transcription elongation factor Elf1